MLQRSQGLSSHFQQESLNILMASNQIYSNLMLNLQQNDCSEEAPVNGSVGHWCSDMFYFYQDGNSQENAEFRFSMSPLPKWALHQVTDNLVPVDMDSNSSKVDTQQDLACHQSQSLSKDNEEVNRHSSGASSGNFSETESSLSPSSPEIYRASNTRWLTIHTVCMDLLDSPTTCVMKGPNMHGSIRDRRCTAEASVMENTHSNKRIKLSSPDTGIDNLPPEPDTGSSEPDNLRNGPLDECKCMSALASLKHSSFSSGKMNFGNFSAEPKTERRKSLSRSNYPSGFLVRREVLEGRKRSLYMHAQDSTQRKTDSSFLPNKPSTSSLEDAGMFNNGGKEAVDVDEVGESEILRSCEEALHNLEAAAENAVQSFSKLATVNIGEEESKRFERLLAVESKIQALTKLLHPSSNTQG